MSSLHFPTLSIGWSRHRKPVTSSRVAKHVSGRDVKISLQAIPRFSFELLSNGLSSGPAFGAIQANTKQALEAFFTDRLGQFDTFLYRDPDDNQVSGQSLGAGDGVNRTFTFRWPWGSNPIPVGQVETSGLNVYLNGALQDSGSYAVTLPNSLVFTAAPGSGVVVSADYTFYFVCQFDDDTLDFEQFMYRLHSVGSIKFTSIKP